MQQELIRKKKEIIDIFLKKGVLLSPELLDEIKDVEQIPGVIHTLESGKKYGAVTSPLTGLTGISSDKECVKIISSYKEEPKKRDPQDFVDYFNNRYKGLEKILKQRIELSNTTSISKVAAKKDKGTVSIIGIVGSKQITKNGNLLITLEDPTGIIKVVLNKNKPALFNEAKDIVLDEVIGIIGANSENIIFANNVIWPDTPTNKDLKKSAEENYALFLSDLHVGSSKFLQEDFERFLRWINGEMGNEHQRKMASKVKYIFIAGDLVDGCGIYPEQDKELAIKDIYDQYRHCAELLKRIPGHIPLIICPGNHDALRISEPQPTLSEDFAKPMHEIENAIMVSNPSYINIDASPDFAGFDVLMYHGYSFDYFVSHVDSLRNQGGYDRPDLIIKFLLKRRHLAPTHLSTLYIPDPRKDPLIIEKVPDFFLSGHIHKSSTANYRNSTLICGSCWQGKTIFQERVGHNPEPSRVPIVNLQTREMKILKFGQ